MKKEIKINNNTGVLDIKGDFAQAMLYLKWKTDKYGIRHFQSA